MYVIRVANPSDAPLLCDLINELAEYEKLEQHSQPDVGRLAYHLRPYANPGVKGFIAEVNQIPAGFLLYFFSYSTFKTEFCIHVEDIYVREDYRGKGLGYLLMRELARSAVAHGCFRINLNVLAWNGGAIRMYEKLGFTGLNDWQSMRLEGDALRALAR